MKYSIPALFWLLIVKAVSSVRAHEVLGPAVDRRELGKSPALWFDLGGIPYWPTVSTVLPRIGDGVAVFSEEVFVTDQTRRRVTRRNATPGPRARPGPDAFLGSNHLDIAVS
jgi:hypothetical protein